MTKERGFFAKIRPLVHFAMLLVLLASLTLATQAQLDDRAAAPGKLSVETTEDGLVLSWEAPASEPEKVTGYEIAGLHVQRGVGIVEELTGFTDEKTTSWTDQEAKDPELLYVYRVRALRGGEQGQWSSFVITGFERVPLPSTPAVEFEPGAVVPEPPVEPTAALPQPEPTSAGEQQDAPGGSSGQSESRSAPQQQAAEPTAVPPRPEPTTAPPVVEVKPTAAPPQPEPTAAMPEPQPTAPPAGQQQAAEEPPAPTAVPSQPEPTTAPPVVEVKPTAAPPQPEPTAARPGPEATQSS